MAKLKIAKVSNSNPSGNVLVDIGYPVGNVLGNTAGIVGGEVGGAGNLTILAIANFNYSNAAGGTENFTGNVFIQRQKGKHKYLVGNIDAAANLPANTTYASGICYLVNSAANITDTANLTVSGTMAVFAQTPSTANVALFAFTNKHCESFPANGFQDTYWYQNSSAGSQGNLLTSNYFYAGFAANVAANANIGVPYPIVQVSNQ